MKTRREKLWSVFYDTICLIVGSICLAFSVQYFCAPNKVSVGGVTGLATMVNYLHSQFPIGTMVLIFNLPLFVLSWIYIGKEGFIKSVIGTVLSSFFMDVFVWIHLEPYKNNILLAALFGGVIGGLGIGLIFLRGGTTGGVDIISRLMKLAFPHMTIGKLILCIEGVLLIATTLVYRNIENALYSMITIYVYSYCIDLLLYGMDRGKAYFIISDHPKEIATEIMNKIDRGVTILEGKGAYTSADKEVLLVAMRTNESIKVRQLVDEIDPSAFIIICNTSETIGLGFKSIKDRK